MSIILDFIGFTFAAALFLSLPAILIFALVRDLLCHAPRTDEERATVDFILYRAIENGLPWEQVRKQLWRKGLVIPRSDFDAVEVTRVGQYRAELENDLREIMEGNDDGPEVIERIENIREQLEHVAHLSPGTICYIVTPYEPELPF